MKKLILFAAIAISFTSTSQKNLSLEDAVMGYYKGLYPDRLTNLQWVSESRFGYVNDNEFQLFDTKFKEKEHFNSVSLGLDSIKGFIAGSQFSSDQIIKRNRDGFTSYSFSGFKSAQEKTTVKFEKGGAHADQHVKSGQIAYTIGNNLYIANSSKSKVQVTNFEDQNIVAGQAIHRYEFGISKGTFWSPSGKLLAFYQKDETKVADYPLLDINQRTGTLNSIKYPMAGLDSENGKVGIYDINTKSTIYLNTNQEYDDYVSNVTWGPEEKYIYIIQINRGQDHFIFNQYDAKSGEKVKTIFEEKSKTFVQPLIAPYFILNNPSEFLYISEKDGFQNIYHYNTNSGLVAQITNFKWEVADIISYDSKTDNIYLHGSSEDGREMHAYSVNIATKKVNKITSEPGYHHISINKNFTYCLDSYSNLDTPGKVDLINLKSNTLKNIFTAENPLKDYTTGQIEFGRLKAEDGQTLYTELIKPADFDPTKKYPVLVYVYGGPGVQMIHNKWLGGSRLWMHWMANQGYLVWMLDNRGSSGRGVAFKEVIHKNLGTNEIKDQLAGVRYLKTLPYVDQERMAVHGWSFGGFMTTSLMTREAGTFTTGVAGGPVIDWKWYEVMYGERYMDTPQENPEGYKTASLLNYVEKLEGKLLMIHGTVDDVVLMQHNLAFVQECVKKGVQLDFFPYPMHPHNVRGKDRVHLMTKVLNYILEYNK